VELSARQQQVLDFIERFLSENGYPPTLRDIGAGLSIRSTNAVNDHLAALERKGAIVRDRSRSRGISLPAVRAGTPGRAAGTPGRAAGRLGAAAGRPPASGPSPAPRLLSIPLVGRIAAGVPLLAEENLDGRILIDPLFVHTSGGLFALRVTGDSMVGDGILDGDVIVVKAQEDAPDGTIVVALVEDEATVKRLYREEGRVRLQPSNPDMAPICVDEQSGRSAVVQGVVVSVLRRL